MGRCAAAPAPSLPAQGLLLDPHPLGQSWVPGFLPLAARGQGSVFLLGAKLLAARLALGPDLRRGMGSPSRWQDAASTHTVLTVRQT